MTRLSVKEAQALGIIPESKYNNQKPEYYDPDLKKRLKFDSNKELEYYLLLKDKLKKGEIFRLQRQVRINIQPPFTTPAGEKVRAIDYLADFAYLDPEGVTHLLDVKGCKTEIYKLKKKLLAYKGFYIEEV